ncbi:hypothetical protein HMPREF0666_00945 [Prevotella sp. C561]|nr:hypothetical protein HMPREF0666_00945 [Prevotella sp. C561]
MNSFEEDALHAPRRACSTHKRGMFLDAEKPLLVSSLSFSRIKKETITETSLQFALTHIVFLLLLSILLKRYNNNLTLIRVSNICICIESI